MKRKESVLLVSRALSLLWGVSALEEVTYLPERLHSFVHYVSGGSFLGFSSSDSYLSDSYRLAVVLLFIRIAIYLALAVVFWKCGPWVEGTLLPEIIDTPGSNEGTRDQQDERPMDYRSGATHGG
jgi:hypothetical protein